MAGPLRVERDVEVARWVQESLSDFGAVTANVPPIFDAYARILHPATLETPALLDDGTVETDAWGIVRYDSREISWAEAAGLIGDRAGEGEAWTAWQARFGDDAIDLPDGRRILGAHGLDIPVPLLAALAELLLESHGDAEVIAGVWEGSGLDVDHPGVVFGWSDEPEAWGPIGRWLQRRRQQRELQRAHVRAFSASIDPEVTAAMRAGDVLGLPRERQGRGHVLLRGRLAGFADPAWVETAGLGWRRREHPDHHDVPSRTPNAIWPAEPHAAPAWFIATDLDLDVTLVGGSAHLIGRLLAHPAIEAERIRPTDPIL